MLCGLDLDMVSHSILHKEVEQRGLPYTQTIVFSSQGEVYSGDVAYVKHLQAAAGSVDACLLAAGEAETVKAALPTAMLGPLLDGGS